MDFEAFAESFSSVALRTVLRLWNDVRAPGRLPSFQQLRLDQLPEQVNRMWVYQLDVQSGRFTGLLSGEQIARAFGKSFRGLPLEDAHSAETYLWVHRVLTRVVTQPAVYRSSGSLYRQAGQLIEGERIALPLSSHGAQADGVIGISDYRDPHLEGPLELLNENEAWLALDAR